MTICIIYITDILCKLQVGFLNCYNSLNISLKKDFNKKITFKWPFSKDLQNNFLHGNLSKTIHIHSH